MREDLKCSLLLGSYETMLPLGSLKTVLPESSWCLEADGACVGGAARAMVRERVSSSGAGMCGIGGKEAGGGVRKGGSGQTITSGGDFKRWRK
jgi:hypothetical protein